MKYLNNGGLYENVDNINKYSIEFRLNEQSDLIYITTPNQIIISISNKKTQEEFKEITKQKISFRSRHIFIQ